MTFQRPRRPMTEGGGGGRLREGGLFSLVDALAQRRAPPAAKRASLESTLIGTRALPRPASTSAFPSTHGPRRGSSSGTPSTGAGAAAPSVAGGEAVLPPRPSKPGTPTAMPPLGDLPGRRGASTPSAGASVPLRAPPLPQPASPNLAATLPATFVRPATQQAARTGRLDTPGTAAGGHRPSSTSRPDRGGRREFHRGLVSALHDVLRQQRHGVFPQQPPPDAGAQQPDIFRHGGRAAAVDDAVRARKAEWAQAQWRDIRRRERLDVEARGRAARGDAERGLDKSWDRGTPGLTLSSIDPDVVAAVLEVEQRELRARGAVMATEDRARRELRDGFARADGDFTAADADTMRMTGNRLYERRNFAGALRCYSAAIDADPSNPLLLTNRAAAALMLMNYDAAVRDCLLAAELDPTLTRAYARMGHAYLLLGQYRQASRQYATALSLAAVQHAGAAVVAALTAESAAVATVERAHRLLDAGAGGDALQHLQGLTTFASDPPIVYLRLEALVNVDPAAARAELSRYLATLEHPACDDSGYIARAAQTAFYCDILVLLARASYYCGQHFFNIAASYVQQCLAIRSECRPALQLRKALSLLEAKLGEVHGLIAAGKLPEAHAALTTALGVDPRNKKVRAMLLYHRAELAMRMKSGAAAAIADLSSALDCDPAHVKALSQRALAFAAIGDSAQALRDMSRAVELNPSLADELEQLRARFKREECPGPDGSQQQQQQRRRPATGSCAERHGESDLSHYEVLELPRFSTGDQVKKQYRRLTLRFHPDKVVSQQQGVRDECMRRFKEINHAYSVLGDAAAKVAYDLSLGNPLPAAPSW